ncbi:MAG: hypothetical protein K2N51_10800 [Lachnospiraceae bacterium]|nr:hypothetical protein [Lachnospiraceae bacterium]
MAKKKGKKGKGRIFVFLCSILFAAIGITIAYAAVDKMINTATNVATVGNVRIELIDKNDETVNLYSKEPGFKNKEVIPGDKISKIVSVKNTGDYAACIRLKVKKEWGWRNVLVSNEPTPDPKTITTAAIVLNYDKTLWKLATERNIENEDEGYEYYYYKDYVRAGEEIFFMDTFYVDENEIYNDQMSPNVMGTIKVEAEAVQADYYAYDNKGNRLETGKLKTDAEGYVIGWKGVSFGPNYTNDEPNIQVATGGAVTGSAVTAGAVNFDSDAGDFVSFPGGNPDLFINVKGIMPGEIRQQTIDIENTMKNQELEVYMFSSIDGLELSDMEWKLLQELQIRITGWERNFEKTGNAKKMAVQTTTQSEWQPLFDKNNSGNRTLLGKFAPGEKARLTIEIMLPGTWEHSYCQTQVNWNFITSKMLITPPPYNPSRPNPTPSLTAEPSEEPTEEPVPVETVEPTDIPINADPPKETPKPTPEPTPTPKPIEPTVVPTPTDFDIGIDEPPMADASAKPKPSKTPKPKSTQKPKKTKKPTTPKPTKNPEENIDSDIPRIDVPPDVPKESATKTGDDTPVFFWSVVCLVSLFGVLYNGIVLGKKKE